MEVMCINLLGLLETERFQMQSRRNEQLGKMILGIQAHFFVCLFELVPLYFFPFSSWQLSGVIDWSVGG